MTNVIVLNVTKPPFTIKTRLPNFLIRFNAKKKSDFGSGSTSLFRSACYFFQKLNLYTYHFFLNYTFTLSLTIRNKSKKMNVVLVVQVKGTEAGADSEGGVAAIVPHPRPTGTTTTTTEIIEGNLF